MYIHFYFNAFQYKNNDKFTKKFQNTLIPEI